MKGILISTFFVFLVSGCLPDPEIRVEEKIVEVESVDTVGPTLRSTSPISEAVDIEISSKVKLVFDEILSEQIPNSSIIIINEATGELVAASTVIEGSNIEISPSSFLDYNTTYIVESDYELYDEYLNKIQEPIYFRFTTIEEPDIAIVLPSNNETVSGIVNVSGTANSEVKQVLVQFGDSGFIEAEGTETWSLDIDTTKLAEGITDISVKGNNGYWDIASDSSVVTIENIDSIVGTWDWVSGNIGYAGAYMHFHGSGVYDESNGTIFFSWAHSWYRQSEDTITISRSSAGPLTVTANISEDGSELMMSWSTSSSNYSVKYSRR